MISDSLRVAEALLPLLRSALGGVELHRTADSVGLMLKGTLFGIISDGLLMFRVDARTRGDYDAAERAALARDDDDDDAGGAAGPDPFGPPGGGALATTSFRRVPAFVLDDEDTLADWGRKAWEAAKRGHAAARTP
ncbi:TfoX/Sxy family protein [Roseospira visakhapatnamensis]|uniref:DNA transformation protein n=1 Tax=Roseospira visakhapatnamensis TaxID=390880 RepID=A0A7W6RGJ7_9PROT|nr:TfoX/Sxy family protein [Roseospira visakhapatnamensis]MBB4268179.1 DNA transformation protein [Roseospira visakhapatnamensis]